MYFVELHGQGTSAWPGSSGAPTEWTAVHEEAVVAERVEDVLSHAGHGAHRHGDVRGVGDLDAERGQL